MALLLLLLTLALTQFSEVRFELLLKKTTKGNPLQKIRFILLDLGLSRTRNENASGVELVASPAHPIVDVVTSLSRNCCSVLLSTAAHLCATKRTDVHSH